jgi:hypothetical protein
MTKITESFYISGSPILLQRPMVKNGHEANTMKIKITTNGTIGGTRFTDAETGAHIDGIDEWCLFYNVDWDDPYSIELKISNGSYSLILQPHISVATFLLDIPDDSKEEELLRVSIGTSDNGGRSLCLN